jgi:L-threonylcarbamoyladenylate synthase
MNRTRRIVINPRRPQSARIREAAAVLVSGGTVAFPTETVYGLGADALSAKAVRRIFRAKGRPGDNPLIVHVASRRQARTLVRSWPPVAEQLARRFWPGPLTLILPRSPAVPNAVTAGLDTVAVRMPRHPIALALIRAAGVPVAAPSANRSGSPSPTTAAHVLDDLQGRIDCLVDGGVASLGLESTVIDLTSAIPVVLRPGRISVEQLRRVIGRVRLDRGAAAPAPTHRIVRSPGMKYRHYAPRACLILVEGRTRRVAATIRRLTGQTSGTVTGVISTNRRRRYPNALTVFAGSSPSSIARNLYRLLRELDHHGVHTILVEGIEAREVGLAVMNRLRKAASRVVHAG